MDTIADGKIDQTESSSYGYGRFTAQFGQRIEAAALSTCHDDGCYILHAVYLKLLFSRKHYSLTLIEKHYKLMNLSCRLILCKFVNLKFPFLVFDASINYREELWNLLRFSPLCSFISSPSSERYV